MRPKLTDVAKKAGVSVTTVSRVINDYGYISQKTRDKVFAAMEELNYQPNSLARSLHGKSTNLVGLIFPAITNPFFAELVEKIEQKLFSEGYKVILCNAGSDKEKEREYLKMLLANRVDGIIAGHITSGSTNTIASVYRSFHLTANSQNRSRSSPVITMLEASWRSKNSIMRAHVTFISWEIRTNKVTRLING